MLCPGGRVRCFVPNRRSSTIAASGRHAMMRAPLPIGRRRASGRALGLVALGFGAVTDTDTLQGEEPRAAPGRAGDRAGDCRQARIRRSLPVETLARDRDGVALSLILANQHGAGFELPTAGAALAREAVQERQAVAIKTPEGLLLQPHGDHAREQIFAQTRRRLAAE